MIWYLPNLLALFLMGWWLRPKPELRKVYWAGMLLKMLAGIALGYLYFSSTEGGDTLLFHEEATRLYTLAKKAPGSFLEYFSEAHHPIYKSEFRTELFVKIISVFYLISGGDYWICSLYLSLVSFLGAWYFLLSINALYPKLFGPAVVSVLFIPTVIFWTSGVLKDPLIQASVFFLAGVCVRYHENHPLRSWHSFLTAASLIVLFYFKYYLLAIILPLMACLLLMQILASVRMSKIIKITVSSTVLLVVLLLATRLNWNLNLSHLPSSVHTNYTIILSKSPAHNALNFPNLQPTWKSLLIHMPQSLTAGLIRPLPAEGSVFNFFSWIENVLLVVLILFNLYFFKRIKLNLLVILALCYVLTLAAMLPLAAPNFGTLIRYRAAYLPFLFLLLSILPYYEFIWKKKRTEI